MMRAFTSLTEHLKCLGIKPGFHFMDNKASTALELTMKTMKNNYQLVPPIKHRANNADRLIQIFINHFIAVLCSVDKYFHLRL